MTKEGRRLIEDFLLPALNQERYGDLLKWVKKEEGSFCLRWSHKNAAKWKREDTEVFTDWDKLKGHYNPDLKNYHMQSKQRFRAALYKLNTVQRIPSQDKTRKYYKLCLDRLKRTNTEGRRMQKLNQKRGSQKFIPTPVICKNTFGKGTKLVGKEVFEESSSSGSSSSSPFYIKSDDSDQANDKVDPEEYQDYLNAIRRQRKQSSPNHYPQHNVKNEVIHGEVTVLRENPQMNVVHKVPHVPIQLAPVYNKATSRQTEENPLKYSVETLQNQQAAQNAWRNQLVENTQPRVESPSILLVPTYNATNSPRSNDKNVAIDPQMESDVVSFMYKKLIAAQHNTSDGALNLSVKCESEMLLCR